MKQKRKLQQKPTKSRAWLEAKSNGLATASIERMVAGGRRIQVTRMRITGAGRQALTKLRGAGGDA